MLMQLHDCSSMEIDLLAMITIMSVTKHKHNLELKVAGAHEYY